MSKYIDRAALFNRLANTKTWADVFAAIQEAPTADVQEVRHGRWELDEYGGWHCSVCHEIAIVNGGENYCPNCGALMVNEDE